MQLLAAHPQVVVFRRFPYESAPGQVLAAHAARAVRARQHGSSPPHPDDVLHATAGGSAATLSTTTGCTSRCRSRRGSRATYIREPGGLLPAPHRRLVHHAGAHAGPAGADLLRREAHVAGLPAASSRWELYPRAKEVFLVRDFRDMARSIMSFDARRGFAGFGAPAGRHRRGVHARGADGRWRADLQQRRGRRAGSARIWSGTRTSSWSPSRCFTRSRIPGAGRFTRDRSHVLETASEQVLRLPGASFEASEVMAHRTVPDPRATIGRWREDSPDGLGPLSDEVFGDALVAFGYA